MNTSTKVTIRKVAQTKHKTNFPKNSDSLGSLQNYPKPDKGFKKELYILYKYPPADWWDLDVGSRRMFVITTRTV